VVTVDDIDRYSGFRESPQSVAEAQLRPDMAVGAIVDIAGDHQEVGLLFNAEVNEIAERLERRFLQPVADTPVYVTQAAEGAVYVQVCCVYESERLQCRSSGRPCGRFSRARQLNQTDLNPSSVEAVCGAC
jgi:hypothetical protein